MKVRVTNIQRFCLNDGKGIRTTVFLKGCNLRCPWCSNPENMNFEKEEYIKNSQNGIYGEDLEIDELFNEIIKDKEYYLKSNGGVTFSGGEALLHSKALLPLLKRLKDNNINICFETSLFVPYNLIELVIPYIDSFIIDIKILNEEKALNILNGSISLYYSNLDLLYKTKKIEKFRIPLVKEYTLDKDNINKIIELCKKYNDVKVEIFKIHNLGFSKYESLGLKANEFLDIDDEEVEEVYKLLSKENIEADIIKL